LRPSDSEHVESLGGRARRAWRHVVATPWTVRRALALVGLMTIAMIFLGAGGATAAWVRACAGGCPTAAQIADFAPRQASEVYDANGDVLGLFYRERRQLVSLSDLPSHVPLAFVAIEDRRFFDHEGVDDARRFGRRAGQRLRRLGRPAAAPSPCSWRATSSRSSSRAARRASAGRWRRSGWPGDGATPREGRILELYLNNIYLGAGAYGVEAAARTYFDKPASELDYAGGGHAGRGCRRPPRTTTRAATRTWRSGAATGAPQHGVDRRDHRGRGGFAAGEPITLSPPRGALRAPYFVEQIRRELEDRFGELLYTGGLRIHTSLDPELQQRRRGVARGAPPLDRAGRLRPFPHPTRERFNESLEDGSRSPGPLPAGRRRRARPAHRRHPRDGGRARLPPLAVQPRERRRCGSRAPRSSRSSSRPRSSRAARRSTPSPTDRSS
jgi:penicillin-binding protein 1A